MFEPVRIAPSVLSADFMNMERDICAIEQGGAGFVHVDVMDGHFTPNITVGVPFVRGLSRITGVPLDVHLMVANPLVQMAWFLDAGAASVTVHLEALGEGARAAEGVCAARAAAHAAGARFALAIRPDTPVEELSPFIALLDMVLVMSVQPGFSGQHYIAGSERRVAQAASLAQAAHAAPLIEVDGGIGPAQAALLAAAGADVLVAGNAVFGTADVRTAIDGIAQAARRGCPGSAGRGEA